MAQGQGENGFGQPSPRQGACGDSLGLGVADEVLHAALRYPHLDQHRFHLTIDDGQLGIGGFMVLVGFRSGV